MSGRVVANHRLVPPLAQARGYVDKHAARLVSVGRRDKLDVAVTEALGVWPGGCGMRPPRRTTNPDEAIQIAAREGVSVLTSLEETDCAAADRLPRMLWGDRLMGWMAPAEIRNTGQREVLTLGKANGQAALTNRHRRPAHTDSYRTHGANFSDFFLLLFARASSQGGESFAVDGYRTVAALSAHPVTAPLMALLPTRSVMQVNIAVSSGGIVKRVAPMCGWGPASCEADVQPYGATAGQRSEGRFHCQICHDAEALEDDVHAVETNEMLYVFYKAVDLVQESAPRFRVESSELLIFDNWRAMHGREPCELCAAVVMGADSIAPTIATSIQYLKAVASDHCEFD